MQPIKIEDILAHLWISGRSSRAEWWRVHILCGVLAVMLDHAMFAQLAPRAGGAMPAISLLWPICSLALAWVSFASVVRRFHDRGKSGWWALLYFVPGIGWMWILVECGFLPGKASVASTYNPAPTPAPNPMPAPAPASRYAASLRASPRAGTVQRAEYRPWDRKRAMKIANVAVRFAIAATAAIILYKFALDPETFGVLKVQSMRTLPE
jgi:uncharacterized membrane protein YhaH (DUF805 family)